MRADLEDKAPTKEDKRAANNKEAQITTSRQNKPQIT